MKYDCLTLWDAGEYERLLARLTNYVTKNCWYMAGELYWLFGELGQGPGIEDRDWDDNLLYPLPNGSSRELLSDFVDDLKILPAANPVEVVDQDVFKVACKKRNMDDGVLWKPYHKIVMEKSEYEIGAARIFGALVANTKMETVHIGLAGLILILMQGIDRTQIRGKVALCRAQERVKQNG
jgi:hypothetical protein